MTVNKLNTLAPNYGPRYQLEETIATNTYTKDENTGILSSLCSHCCKCCCKCLHFIVSCISPSCIKSSLCGSRKRATLLITISAVVSLIINIFVLEPLALSFGNQRNFSLAKEQSYGFFANIPRSRWKLLQKRVQDQRKKERKRGWKAVIDPSHYAKASQFYQHHWQADFTCPHERFIGVAKDGGKYLCDPHNIVPSSNDRLQQHNGNSCLVYISSSDVNQYIFEKELLKAIGTCEIHVFSPNDQPELHNTPPNIYFHAWGFRGENSEENSDSEHFFTFMNTLRALGHCGKTIDLFSLDCEGCEFDIYKDLFIHDHSEEDIDSGCSPAALMQILVQVHGAPTNVINDFFSTFQDQGYVTFHKGPSIEGSGNEQDYGFLKLSDEFFSG